MMYLELSEIESVSDLTHRSVLKLIRDTDLSFEQIAEQHGLKVPSIYYIAIHYLKGSVVLAERKRRLLPKTPQHPPVPQSIPDNSNDEITVIDDLPDIPLGKPGTKETPHVSLVSDDRKRGSTEIDYTNGKLKSHFQIDIGQIHLSWATAGNIKTEDVCKILRAITS